MNILKELGQTIRTLRQDMGLTQEELAEKAGLHISYIGSVERGERNLTLQSIHKIAAALNFSLSDLFSLVEKPSRTKEKPLPYLSRVSPEDAEFFENLIKDLIDWKRNLKR